MTTETPESRHTPETDAVIEKSQFQNRLVMLIAHARKMESERNEAVRALKATLAQLDKFRRLLPEGIHEYEAAQNQARALLARAGGTK